MFSPVSVCLLDYTKTAECISAKLRLRMDLGPKQTPLTFGADQETERDPWLLFSLSLTLQVYSMPMSLSYSTPSSLPGPWRSGWLSCPQWAWPPCSDHSGQRRAAPSGSRWWHRPPARRAGAGAGRSSGGPPEWPCAAATDRSIVWGWGGS